VGARGAGHKLFASKAQHRFFAARMKRSPKWRKWFHEKAVRGRYRGLPERKRGVSARTIR
jgi:hypothetical protein